MLDVTKPSFTMVQNQGGRGAITKGNEHTLKHNRHGDLSQSPVQYAIIVLATQRGHYQKVVVKTQYVNCVALKCKKSPLRIMPGSRIRITLRACFYSSFDSAFFGYVFLSNFFYWQLI